jgi:hypothetical protein
MRSLAKDQAGLRGQRDPTLTASHTTRQPRRGPSFEWWQSVHSLRLLEGVLTIPVVPPIRPRWTGALDARRRPSSKWPQLQHPHPFGLLDHLLPQ